MTRKIEGAENYDEEWIAKVKEANPDIKILPRIMMPRNEFPPKLLHRMHNGESIGKNAKDKIVRFLKGKNIDGVVMDASPFMYSFNAAVHEFVGLVGEAVKAEGWTFIVTI